MAGGMGRGFGHARLGAAEVARRAVAALRRAGRRLTRPFGPVADRLVIAPQDLRTADPTVAADIHFGRFVFAGRAVECGEGSPFLAEPPSREWSRQLHGFGWLRHLRAADPAIAREDARRLVVDWVARGARTPVASEPEVTARRLLAFLAQAPMLLDACDDAFYETFLGLLTDHARALRDRFDLVPPGPGRIQVAVALVAVSVAVEGFRRHVKGALKRLDEELARQIFPDGGHVGRNPATILDILVDLLPVRQMQAARGIPVGPTVMNAIDRMMHLLRFFRHGDGALALFNGASVTLPGLVASVLVQDEARGRPPGNAPHAGYQRLEAGAAVAIMDCGPPPPPAYGRAAHAGTLAFEFSSGRHRLVVNCGNPLRGAERWREIARTTAAHSTVTIADRSSAEIATGTLGRLIGPALVDGPTAVPVDRQEHDGAVAVIASHDGYAAAFRLEHERTLRLSADGDRLDGRDRLHPVGDGAAVRAPFAARFHLHPAIRATALRPDLVVLVAPDGETWEFHSDGAPVAIEDSVFLADPHRARTTRQLVIEGTAPVELRWTFVRAAPGRDDRRT